MASKLALDFCLTFLAIISDWAKVEVFAWGRAGWLDACWIAATKYVGAVGQPTT